MDYFAPKLSPQELQAISAIGLAHMGDAVYELLVRTWLCVHGKATGKELHRATVALVCAPEQARCAVKLLPLLTEEETAVYKRGSHAEYHAATALECLLGWLYLRGDKARIEALFSAMMEENGYAS